MRRPFEISVAELRQIAEQQRRAPGHHERANGVQLGLTAGHAPPEPACHTDPDGSHTCCGNSFGGWCVCHGGCTTMKWVCGLFGHDVRPIPGGYTCGDVPIS